MDNFSTDPQIRTLNGNRLLILIQNTTSTAVNIDVTLRNLQNSNNDVTTTVTIDPNSTKVLHLSRVPTLFEVIISNVPSGVYFTVYTGRRCSNGDFLISQQFFYKGNNYSLT